MDAGQLKAWRNGERERLIGARMKLDAAALEQHRTSIDAHIERTFPELATAIVAFCWPIKNEYDARHLARTLRERGALTALPTVVAPRQPLEFRLWKPGDKLAEGALGIPYPAATQAVVPEFALVPVNGFDARGYRLGYGGGFFDRTLAALAAQGRKPVAIGVGYEIARMQTIHPQGYDVPMDFIVTESGVFRRDSEAFRLAQE
jgi:5-formyltetrahydrofolate cyclo-ligase